MIVSGDSDVLRYCGASSRTLAISHVWSHGQGGRPDDGINTCLHKRYCEVAKAFRCDSYWIDSACIPSDEQLRKEAILTINKVFSDSKVTMVSDQDLQSVDLSSSSVNDLETLLSILLVCDWNVRAWTMLEAVSGSGSIHILCSGDHTISLVDLLRKVHREGAIDLAVLLGSAQHLVPSSIAGSAKAIEEASFLLSQRHASRADDEIIIWSLLNNGPAHKEALRLWKAQSQVQTAFLISSAPRIDMTPGYGWAPRSPYIRPQARMVNLNDLDKQHYTVRYPSYDGQGSFTAQITDNGLLGKWLAWDMDSTVISAYRDDFCYRNSFLADGSIDLHTGSDRKLYEQPDTANACDIICKLLTSHGNVRVLRPLAEDGTAPYSGGSNRGEQYGSITAICASTDGGKRWEWKGVYQWLEDYSHPGWEVKEMLVV